jgi:hypothetical protein
MRAPILVSDDEPSVNKQSGWITLVVGHGGRARAERVLKRKSLSGSTGRASRTSHLVRVALPTRRAAKRFHPASPRMPELTSPPLKWRTVE